VRGFPNENDSCLARSPSTNIDAKHKFQVH
jgi:hypothetical protein